MKKIIFTILLLALVVAGIIFLYPKNKKPFLKKEIIPQNVPATTIQVEIVVPPAPLPSPSNPLPQKRPEIEKVETVPLQPKAVSPSPVLTTPTSDARIELSLDTSAYYKSEDPKEESDDYREFQHGIDFIPRSDGSYYLIWSSSGNPPTGSNGDNWTHDVYYSIIDPKAPQIQPITLISKPEAQEPISSAISTNGTILLTMEDEWNTSNEIDQRYAVYNSRMEVMKEYPQTVMQGGHSGHAAAVGNKFVIFFSEGWVDGGGVDNLGSGDDVYASMLSSNGTLEKTIPIAKGETRDWWPLITASPTRAVLVWQRFVDDEEFADLYISVLDTQGTPIKNEAKLESGVKYYTYNVNYIPALDRFLVLGSYANGGGFGYLIDSNGNVTGSNKALPAVVRESQSIVKNTIVIQPISPSGVAVYDVKTNSITLRKKIADPYQWQYTGTDGIFIDAHTVYIVSLSVRGLVEKLFEL